MIVAQTHYDTDRILLSFVISFLGAYMATSLCEQLRAYYIRNHEKNFLIMAKWIVLIGVSLGGIGIWSMHFIGMSALSLEHGRVDIHYNIAISIASLIIVIFTSICGVLVSSFDPMFTKTKGEILEMFITDTSQLSLSEIRKMKNTKLFWIISTNSLHYLLLGGLIEGSGVCIMHYIGMEAMAFGGKIEWNAGIVSASIVIALVASSAAFWILFRLLSLFPNRESLRLSCSFVMAVAVCGMHYTGMAAATMSYDTADSTNFGAAEYMHQSYSFHPVLIAVLLTLAFITIVLLEDLRKLVNKPTGCSQRAKLYLDHNAIMSNESHKPSQKSAFSLKLGFRSRESSNKVASIATTPTFDSAENSKQLLTVTSKSSEEV